MNEESFETITGGWYCFTCTAGFKLTAEIRGARVTLAEREDGGQMVGFQTLWDMVLFLNELRMY